MLQVQEHGNDKIFNPLESWQKNQVNVKDAGAVAKEILDLIQRINKAIHSEKAMRTALTSVMAIHKPRIFEGGQDSNKGRIGTYSTTPISISKGRQARSTGKTFFKGGYDEYKRLIGKNPGYKNYRNTDQMQMDYQIIESGGTFAFGFSNKENFNKSQWLQDQDDKDVFDLAQNELDLLGDVHKSEVEKLL